jgi:hypothetical protein
MDTIELTGSAGNAYFLLEGDKQALIKEAEVFAGKLQRLSVCTSFLQEQKVQPDLNSLIC